MKTITETVEVVDNKICNKTVFAFDYDNTISRDADVFITMMKMLQLRGHDVFVVTARRPDVHPEDFYEIEKEFKVYKTRHIAKRLYMREVEGIEVDVWVDDMQEAIIDRKSVVSGKSVSDGVDMVGGRILKKREKIKRK